MSGNCLQRILDFGFWILDCVNRVIMVSRWYPAASPARVPDDLRPSRLRSRRLRRSAWLGVALASGLLLALPASAELMRDEKSTSKRITGEVGGVGAKFIAVEYKHDLAAGTASEMAFPVDDKAVLQRIKNLKELKLGDKVEVEYRETEFKNEHNEVMHKRVATRIALISAAPAEASATPATAAQ